MARTYLSLLRWRESGYMGRHDECAGKRRASVIAGPEKREQVSASGEARRRQAAAFLEIPPPSWLPPFADLLDRPYGTSVRASLCWS